MKIEFSSISEIGPRKQNQDDFFAGPLDDRTYLFAVADGMGGTFGGEVASEIAIASLRSHVIKNLDALNSQACSPSELLQSSIEFVQAEIQKRKTEDEQLFSMGTTLVVLLISGNHYAYCHIGDSRAYVLEEGLLKQLTEDHSFLNEYKAKMAAGQPLSELLIRKYESKITRVLDGGNHRADFSETLSFQEDAGQLKTFILCSDGLILNKVQEADYLKKFFIESNLSLDQATKDVVDFALQNGANDNLTLIAATVSK